VSLGEHDEASLGRVDVRTDVGLPLRRYTLLVGDPSEKQAQMARRKLHEALSLGGSESEALELTMAMNSASSQTALVSSSTMSAGTARALPSDSITRMLPPLTHRNTAVPMATNGSTTDGSRPMADTARQTMATSIEGAVSAWFAAPSRKDQRREETTPSEKVSAYCMPSRDSL
jgi:hypothetical protein